MGETRGAKCGRMWAYVINDHLQAKGASGNYKSRLAKEIASFSFQPRKKGESPNGGCNWELLEVAELDLDNPVHYARVVKERIHLMYQKQTAKRVLDALLENLDKE